MDELYQTMKTFIDEYCRSERGKSMIATMALDYSYDEGLKMLDRIAVSSEDPLGFINSADIRTVRLQKLCRELGKYLTTISEDDKKRQQALRTMVSVICYCHLSQGILSVGDDLIAQVKALLDDTKHKKKSSSKPSMTKEEFLALGEQSFDDYPERADESVLYKNGYTVAQSSNMTEGERQALLSRLIRTNVISKGRVIGHLKHLIYVNGRKEANQLAVYKWKRDLDYILHL